MKLQYEILNKSVEHLAAENDIPINMLRTEIERLGWTQWWPESDLILYPDTDKDEQLQAQSETFIERTKRRLAVYNLAKEMYLAQKYLELETQIIDTALKSLIRANEVNINMDAGAITALSNLYKNMTSKSIASALSTISFGEDEGGLPTVIIKDLSGSNRAMRT